MEKLLRQRTVRWFINIPWLWDIAQNILGENQWKRQMYPVPIIGGRTLLDFGCSIGNETEAFLGFDYYGIDIDPTAIEAAEERFRDHSNVQFFCLDITKEPFRKDFFDHILFAATGHHLNDEQLSDVLRALMGNLKPGGQLHFFDHIRRPGKDSWTARLVINIDQGRNIRTEDEYRKFFDYRVLNIKEWKLIPSPEKFIKLPDFLYIRVEK
jgi:SAM-dependent methyltransferase